jgi:hypothetical protein
MTELIDWVEARGGSQAYPAGSGLPELAQFLPAIEAAAPTPTASAEEPK